jgi:hypothetical protein
MSGPAGARRANLPQGYFSEFQNCACRLTQISFTLLPSCPERGALANVTNVGQDAVDADGALDERA